MAGLVLLPLACTAAPPDTEPVDDHDAALQRWEAAGLADYQFDFQQECFCVREQVQPVTIEVRGGSITRVVSRETGEDVEDERLRWHTVRELFDVITDARQQGVTPLNVEYDAELGYPTRIEAGSLAADAGVVYHASNLQPTYTATSLDGFIAPPDDSLEWLVPLADLNETGCPEQTWLVHRRRVGDHRRDGCIGACCGNLAVAGDVGAAAD